MYLKPMDYPDYHSRAIEPLRIADLRFIYEHGLCFNHKSDSCAVQYKLFLRTQYCISSECSTIVILLLTDRSKLKVLGCYVLS